ncbi:hypothetical protein C8J57DRAFT_1223910 [Mycena rebaudengoi]|nr:hypothetical protein C8J57DRAFT_1223910 [Mycena rebaudengoi]
MAIRRETSERKAGCALQNSLCAEKTATSARRSLLWILKGELVDAHQAVMDARRRGDLQAAALAHARWESVRAARIVVDPSITRVRLRRPNVSQVSNAPRSAEDLVV